MIDFSQIRRKPYMISPASWTPKHFLWISKRKKRSISYTSKIKKISSKYGQPNYGDDFKWVV